MAVKNLCKRYGVPLIVNDRIDIALAINAEGVHIGQKDLPVSVARELLGSDKIIGWSVSNERQALEANTLDVDYIGVSPIFPTNTKVKNLDSPLGISGLIKIKKICRKPIICIGGIDQKNAASVLLNGSDGIAVVSAISQANNPKKETEQLKEIICQTGIKKLAQKQIT